VAFQIIALLQTFIPGGSIHHCAYLSIGVTSASGPGLCGVPGEGDSRGMRVWVCKILHANFREYLFHALR
jgi:hypothetical protein